MKTRAPRKTEDPSPGDVMFAARSELSDLAAQVDALCRGVEDLEHAVRNLPERIALALNGERP